MFWHPMRSILIARRNKNALGKDSLVGLRKPNQHFAEHQQPTDLVNNQIANNQGQIDIEEKGVFLNKNKLYVEN